MELDDGEDDDLAVTPLDPPPPPSSPVKPGEVHVEVFCGLSDEFFDRFKTLASQSAPKNKKKKKTQVSTSTHITHITHTYHTHITRTHHTHITHTSHTHPHTTHTDGTQVIVTSDLRHGNESVSSTQVKEALKSLGAKSVSSLKFLKSSLRAAVMQAYNKSLQDGQETRIMYVISPCPPCVSHTHTHSDTMSSTKPFHSLFSCVVFFRLDT